MTSRQGTVARKNIDNARSSLPSLNFRHWLTGNWSDAFAAIYSASRFPEFGRLSAGSASAIYTVCKASRNYVTPLSSDFRWTVFRCESRNRKKFSTKKKINSKWESWRIVILDKSPCPTFSVYSSIGRLVLFTARNLLFFTLIVRRFPTVQYRN